MGYFFVLYGRIGFHDPKSNMYGNFSFVGHLNKKLIFCGPTLKIAQLAKIVQIALISYIAQLAHITQIALKSKVKVK